MGIQENFKFPDIGCNPPFVEFILCIVLIFISVLGFFGNGTSIAGAIFGILLGIYGLVSVFFLFYVILMIIFVVLIFVLFLLAILGIILSLVNLTIVGLLWGIIVALFLLAVMFYGYLCIKESPNSPLK